MSIPKKHYIEDVYEVVRSIPKGRVSTYGAIADFLTLGSARMVGWAMNAAHAEPGVPAQRVVNRNGLLSGKAHFGEPMRMQQLLEADGVTVEKDQVKNFDQLFWDPEKELEL